MKFLLSWVGEFVRIEMSPEELAPLLTSSGLPVETITSAGAGDTLLEVEIFSNRPDCMNVYGLAREVAAATGRPLTLYPSGAPEDPGSVPASEGAKVTIEDADLCCRYDARLLEGISVTASPSRIAGRLEALGMNPVNNVVDATNYVLWEHGHPLHAFDYDELRGGEIRVRKARRGESITTLDGVQRRLDPDMLVIADAERPVALAGVMGGAETMVTDRTRVILIESAHFDPVSVRRTAKRLGLSTDASYRFERGADPEATTRALDRVATLIREVAGGTIRPGIVSARAGAVRRPATLTVRTTRVGRLLGMPVTPAEIPQALEPLGFGVTALDGAFEVTIPSHRQDLLHEVDLVEEVARRLGYDRVPERLPDIAGTGGVDRAGHRRESALRRALAGAGCSEARTTSFISPDLVALAPPRGTARSGSPVTISNPIAMDQEILRTSVLPGLLGAVAHNLNHGNRDVFLYEIGHVFRQGRSASEVDAPVEESPVLGIAVAGDARPAHWLEPRREATFFDLKGLMEGILSAAGLPAGFEPLEEAGPLVSGRSARILAAGRPVGSLGLLSRAWAERFGLKQQVHVAEVDLDALFAAPARTVAFSPLPRYPAVSRDLSLVVDQHQRYGELEGAIRAEAPDRIMSVSIFDRYAGDTLPVGRTGLSVNIVFQHPDRTLSSEEVAELQERIVAVLSSRFGASLR